MAGDRPQNSAYAAFMRTAGDQRSRLNIKNADINIRSKTDGDCDQGTSKAEALVVDGNVDSTLEGGRVSVEAGKSGESLQMMKLITCLSNVLENLPKENIEKLARELRDVHGIYAESELKKVDPEELKKLKTVKGVQKTKLVKHVEGLKK